MHNRLIGLSGAKGSGKDSAAAALVASGWTRLAFADGLREQVSAAFGVTEDYLSARDTKETPSPKLAVGVCLDRGFRNAMVARGENLYVPRSPRWIMQRWGTEYRRADNEHYWTEKLAPQVDAVLAAGGRVVITDVREVHEAIMVRDRGGKCFAVVRPNNPYASGADTHSSETALTGFGFDVTVYNNGSLAGLHAAMLALVDACLTA